MAQSDVVLLVLDAAVGATHEDQLVVDRLRRSKVPVLLVANKVDDASHEPSIWEMMGLGLGDPFPVSALHGRGTRRPARRGGPPAAPRPGRHAPARRGR